MSYDSDADCLPLIEVAPFDTAVVCGCTGPDGGITRLDLHSDSISVIEPVAGIKRWNIPSCDFVYGISLSLYEEKKSVEDGVNHTHVVGEPVADVYGAMVRGNNIILAVADGVSWGKKPRLAARCAVRTSIEYLSANLDASVKSSSTIFNVLKKSLFACQGCILENRATLTTLSVAVVCPLTRDNLYGVFVISVGDSPVFVYSPYSRSTIELTIGSNPPVRDPKDSGGALGPALGIEPDLENLSYSFIPVMSNDTVILMTDGVSDNFIQQPQSVCQNLETILNIHHAEYKESLSAQSIAACLINKVVEKTNEKRQFNSHCIKEGIQIRAKARIDESFAKIVNKITGKLDHATVLTYQIGRNQDK